MEIETFDIEGLLLLKPKVFGDNRGYFIESFNKEKFKELTGIKNDFIQDNESKSNYGVLRGLHFQRPPYSQAKLVRVIQGEVLDVTVDLRTFSPTYGQHRTFYLTGKNKHQVYVPKGFGHGFLVLSESAIFAYKVDNIYAPTHDDGIMYNDKAFNIDWEIDTKSLLLSSKDKGLQSFEKYKENPAF
jgi:dTDP-4-dehydrorhamnose 3,5-epimerase